MSTSHTLVTATQVRELLLAHARVKDKLDQLSVLAPADPQAAEALIAGLAGGQWKIVLGCARALGHADENCAEIAVEGLLKCLGHPYPEVRTDAAAGLLALSSLVPIPLDPLWEALMNEESPHAFLAIGRVILSCLRSGSPAPSHWGPKLHEILEQILELRLTELPLSGTIPPRHTLSLEAPSSAPGLVDRLLGRKQSQQLVQRNDPAPRPVRPENRRFLVDEGDRYRNTPGIIGQLAAIYACTPAEPKARLSLVLNLVQMPLSNFASSQTLVIEAAKLVRDTPGKTALLASMWGWGREYDPTWTGRLAFAAAQARPDLRLPLLQFLRARQSHIDWAGWAKSLSEVSPIDLEPLVAATLAAPEAQLAGWMKLLSQAPVMHIVPALARALAADEQRVASDALERLLQHGQPVPWLLNDIHRLREKWAKEPAMLNSLNSLMRMAIAVPAPRPAGMREPDRSVDWTVEDIATNPFAANQEQSWLDGLEYLEAFYVSGGRIHLLTGSALILFNADETPLVRPLPPETAGSGMSFLAAGHDGDLLFLGPGEQPHLYLLRADTTEFRCLRPSLPREEAPSSGELLSDGTSYGWTKVVERQGQVEGGLSLRKEVTYRIDPESDTLETTWLAAMWPLEVPTIETADLFLPPISFGFSSCGSYRVCTSEGLAIRTGEENPIHSQGRSDGRLAIHLEVFPSRLCRVYLWLK